MYDSRIIIGDFFEKKVMQIFDLVKAETNPSRKVPDLISRDCSFYVEVKASAYDNGGVINETQLFQFEKEINIRRFYAFTYHPLSRNRCIQSEYPSEKELVNALELKSLFLLPFSIVMAHYENSKKRTHPRHQSFVQLKESLAQSIFIDDIEAWKHLNLKQDEYKKIKPHEKIYIVTREGYLERQILESLNLEFI